MLQIKNIMYLFKMKNIISFFAINFTVDLYWQEFDLCIFCYILFKESFHFIINKICPSYTHVIMTIYPISKLQL